MPYLKIVQSGAQIEVYEYEKEPIRRESSYVKRRARKSRMLVTGLYEKRADNAYRARRNLTRLIRANLGSGSSPSFITLTVFTDVDGKTIWGYYRVFCRRLTQRFKNNLRFIAVLEFQKSSGFAHLHVLVWGIPEYEIKRERNSRSLQHLWARGFLDCITTNGSSALAGYLAKYLRKGLQDGRLNGGKAYTSSRNVLRPVFRSFSESFQDVKSEFVAVDKLPLKEIVYDTYWLGKGRYQLYN